MKARTPTPGLRNYVSALWDARLAAAPPPFPPQSADTAVTDPFDRAARIASDLHATLEMPMHGPRQPRAVLTAMAAVALRRTE